MEDYGLPSGYELKVRVVHQLENNGHPYTINKLVLDKLFLPANQAQEEQVRDTVFLYKYDEEIDAINIKWYSAADDIDIESYRIEIKSNSCDEATHPCWFEAHEDCDGSLPEVMDAK